ncbi:helix-turn-helix transcriptional regulator [Sulfitobacter donghicola]|uniref:helix-turn-helix transcriptional regulator n=1 Tax=Sulfitobacter donghicola TaxID=421000 RepID=UPI00055DBCAD|nr:autoinducer binding domain-containing protein [Sulfitobacter donghicola]KIN67136.1 Autoinducer-binding transcriptional regulator LuxR [Sulfitobacter donghicola DSW-25 = KCTC 12864 = JCM 14565]
MLGKHTKLESILSDLEQVGTLEGMQGVSEALKEYYAIDHLVYHWVDSNGDQYGCGTYSDAWQQKYIEENYLRIDPVVQGCFQRFHPVDWKRLEWSSKAAREFLKVSAEYGVGNQGFSIPIRGPNGQFAMFTVNHSCEDDEWAKFTQDNRRDLILIAHYFNEKALEFEPGRQPEQPQPLSPREVDAMTLLAIGYSRAQVANSLAISEHTLRVYIESARFKLGALNTTHAVARALSRGLIVV